MNDSSYPNPLGQLNPVSDGDASERVSPAGHTRLLDAITSEPRSAPRRRRAWFGGRQLILAAATAAVLVVVLPGLLSGSGNAPTQPAAAQAQILAHITRALASRPGTIVVEDQRTTLDSGKLRSVSRYHTLTEASATGTEERSLTIITSSHRAVEQEMVGNLLELYDNRNRTIYVTTARALQAAIQRQLLKQLHQGANVSSTSVTVSFRGADFVPGRTSVAEQQLRHHLYRLGSRTTIDGRPALTLVPVHQQLRAGNSTETFPTIYVSPSTYYPIREVTSAGAMHAFTVVTTWSEYKVLPATAANRRLLSLRALHPGARVVHSVAGYLRAQTSSSKPTQHQG